VEGDDGDHGAAIDILGFVDGRDFDVHRFGARNFHHQRVEWKSSGFSRAN
jgi:hypothetical protein